MRYILITGANRGLGLAFARHYIEAGDFVFAACRTPDVTDKLHQLAREHSERLNIVQMDVTNSQEIADAHAHVAARCDQLHLLINNAGINARPYPDNLDNLNVDDALLVYHTNAVAPMLITRTFLDLLKRNDNPRVINLSSGAASMSDRTRERGGSFAYAASKAALNMYTRALAGSDELQGIAVVAFDPGWVRTDMGGQHAAISIEESIQGLTQQIEKLTAADSGKFLNRDGSTHPW